MDDQDEGKGRRKKGLSRGGVWGIVIGGLILFGFGVYAALPLLFGTREGATVGECTEHTTYGRTASTSYRCEVQLKNGTNKTVTFDSSKNDGEHVSLTMWGDQIVEVHDATVESWLFAGGGLTLTAGAAWYLRHTRARAGTADVAVPSG